MAGTSAENPALAKRVREAADAAKMTHGELGYRVGLSAAHVSEQLRGRRTIGHGHLELFAVAIARVEPDHEYPKLADAKAHHRLKYLKQDGHQLRSLASLQSAGVYDRIALERAGDLLVAFKEIAGQPLTDEEEAAADSLVDVAARTERFWKSWGQQHWPTSIWPIASATAQQAIQQLQSQLNDMANGSLTTEPISTELLCSVLQHEPVTRAVCDQADARWWIGPAGRDVADAIANRCPGGTCSRTFLTPDGPSDDQAIATAVMQLLVVLDVEVRTVPKSSAPPVETNTLRVGDSFVAYGDGHSLTWTADPEQVRRVRDQHQHLAAAPSTLLPPRDSITVAKRRFAAAELATHDGRKRFFDHLEHTNPPTTPRP